MFAPRSRRPRVAALVLAGLIVLAVGVLLGGHPSWLPSPVRSVLVSQNPNDKIVNQVIGLLQRDYYRTVDTKALVNKGLQAAVESLGDPYSHYYDPTDYDSFQDEEDPHLSGIGIDIVAKPKGLLVQSVIANSPASKAGLSSGDLITRVGSTSLAKRSADFAGKLIKGRAGTRVTITVLHAGHTRDVTVTRADISEPVAASKLLTYKGTKVGYVELSRFADGAGDEVRAQVAKVRRQGAQALILDLRANGGGLLDEGVNVASIFIPDGTIVSTAGRSVPRQVYMAKGHAIPTSIPLVVLVDHNTASAAEIVTGALKDRGRAKVVGTRTYGKGVFQEIQPLSNGGALDFTIGEYFTPNGHNLGGGGVKRGGGVLPDVEAVTDPHAKTDTALTVAEKTVAAEVR